MTHNDIRLEHFAPPQPVVFFVGNSINFSKTLVKLVNSEIDDVKVIHLADLGKLQHSLKLYERLPLIVLDESMAQYMEARLTEFADICKASHIAVAYRDAEVASHLLARHMSSVRSGKVSAFPLNIQLEVFISVIRIMLCGERYIHCELTLDSFFMEPCAKAVQTSAVENLTKRETQVLSLVAEGKQNKAIAHELALSEHTVKLHMHNVLSKLGLANRTEASAWFNSSTKAVTAGAAE